MLKEWKPYYTLDKNGKPTGYAIELFEKIASNIDLKYEYVIVDNWKDANTLLEKNEAQIIPNIGITLKRGEYLYFTQDTDIFEISLFKNKNSNNTIPLKTGVVVKNACMKLINEDANSSKIIFQNYHSALAALENNEIDMLCYPKTIVQNSIQDLNLNNIDPLAEPIKTIKRGIGVSRNELHLMEIFDKELLRLKGNGEYQAIYDKWFYQHKDIEIDYEQFITINLILAVLILIILFYLKNSKLIMTKASLDQAIKEIELLNKKEIENQKLLMTQAKVAAVGEMLGNISHQWRQPLSAITTRVSALQININLGEEPKKEELIKCTNDVIKQADYLSKTIDDFRSFFIADLEHISQVDLHDLFSKLKDLVYISFKNNFIECIHTIENGIIVNINDNLLIQALLNICNNAKDALVENIKNSENRYFFVDVKKIDQQAVIIFKDSGGGIDSEIIKKIFEPYFTTKHQSVGTGIGLYMTHQIITKHLKGSIEVENEEFEYENKKLKGAKFTIKIPL